MAAADHGSLHVDSVLVRLDTPIREVVKAIDRSGRFSIALLVNSAGRLLYTVTDGDIRRGILAAIPMDAPAKSLLPIKRKMPHFKPVTAPAESPPDALLALMREKAVRQVPLLGPSGRPVGVAILSDLLPRRPPRMQAVVMAGGLGTRLRPLTADMPKPMLPVAGRPVMEHILKRLEKSGIRKVNVMTHYKAEKIVAHFGDGHEFGVELNYIREEKPLGTGGALSLMAEPEVPLLVINGDIVTDVNFAALLEFHQEQKADLTVAVRQYDVQVPYGVVECTGPAVRGLSEKPLFRFFVNAGIYLLEPAVTKLVPPDQRFDMTDLIQRLLDTDRPVVSFPIVEYWLDIGGLSDYAKVNEDVKEGRVGR
jgi:dTDP-glucose pyrophosphorylase